MSNNNDAVMRFIVIWVFSAMLVTSVFGAVSGVDEAVFHVINLFLGIGLLIIVIIYSWFRDGKP